MAVYHVQRQGWQRWPRVLIVERVNDDDSKEERRYIPEGKTPSQWKELCRKMTGLRDKSARESEEKAQLLMEAQDELLSKQAEIDGLRWGIDERDQLIHDMWRCLSDLDVGLINVPMAQERIKFYKMRERYEALGLVD